MHHSLVLQLHQDRSNEMQHQAEQHRKAKRIRNSFNRKG
jgi:hypothetical protein